MGEGKTNMFGKTYNTIGSTDSNFIIKTKGDLKVQWGGKFIDIIKNGKIASANSNILKTASSADQITSDGIYLIVSDTGNEVWVQIDGTKVNLAGELGTMYVSFLEEQTKVSAEQKYTALTNIGFYYESLDQAEQAGIKAGIIFIAEENKLYIVKNGILSEYSFSGSSQAGGTNSDSKGSFEELTVGELRIYKEGSSMNIDSTDLQFYINNQLCATLSNIVRSYFTITMADGTYIQSEGATADNGFRIYKEGTKSILEVDSIVWRNMDLELGLESQYLNTATIYSTHNNTIASAEDVDGNIVCTLKYQNQFKKDQRVYVFLGLNPHVSVSYQEVEEQIILTAQLDNDLLASQDIEITVNYSINEMPYSGVITILSGENSGDLILTVSGTFGVTDYAITSGPQDVIAGNTVSKNSFIECTITEINGQQITIEVDSISKDLFLAKCSNQSICASDCPIIKIEQNNLDLLDRSKMVQEEITNESGMPEVIEKPDETIHTRIGVVRENDLESLKKCPEKEEEVKVGIYSDNFIGLNSKLYDTVFKKRCNYPKYDISVELPEDLNDEKYNQAVPSLEWIKELIKQAVPSGTIAMFNGSSTVPEGWAICDGTNGTPNLVGKFIKAVASADEVGDNDSILDENNELILSQDYLPKHSHPHKAHTHSLSGDLSGTTGSSGDLSVSLEYSDYNWGIESVSKTFVTSVTGEGITTETGTVDGVSNIKTQGGTATGGSHTHSISLGTDEGTSLSSATSEEQTLSDSEWPNKPLKIEPRSYSLVFIMKL